MTNGAKNKSKINVNSPEGLDILKQQLESLGINPNEKVEIDPDSESGKIIERHYKKEEGKKMEENIQKENIVLDITLLQDPDDKGWIAFIGNCISEGNTKQEATENLKHIILTVIDCYKPENK